MGFRFSRRIAILPGLKLNLSRSGMSLSAGVPGAHLNFGPRGTYASMGIPGTGLSYRQRLGGSRPPAAAPQTENVQPAGNPENDPAALKILHEGTQKMAVSPEEARRYLADPRFKLLDPETGRRLTPEKLEALIKAGELREKREQQQVLLQAEDNEYQNRLHFWEPLPAIPSVEDWNGALAKKPFENKTAPPPPPDLFAEQAKYLDELTAMEHAGLNKLLPGFVSRSDAKADLKTMWPEKEAQIQEAYNQRCQEYNKQVETASAAWDESEGQRIDWVKKLLAGDLEEINHTVAEVLTGLQLPFKTHCDYFIEESRSVCLQVNLPEREDVIPCVTRKVLKDGSVRDERRTMAAQQTDYTLLAMGACLFLAAELFSYLPLALEIKVAAYTQRPRIKETDPVDAYVMDVTFSRDALKNFVPGQNLAAFFASLGSRFDVRADGGLNRIDPPSWLKHEDYQHLQ